MRKPTPAEIAASSSSIFIKIKMPDLPEELEITDDERAISVCNLVFTSLHPSGNRQEDEEFILENICRVLSEKRRRNVFFVSNPSFSKLDNLREHLLIAVDDQEELDNINEYIDVFLDNVYPNG